MEAFFNSKSKYLHTWKERKGKTRQQRKEREEGDHFVLRETKYKKKAILFILI